MKTLGTQNREKWEKTHKKKLEGKEKVELQHDFSEGQSCMEAMSLAGKESEKKMGLRNLISPML